MTAELLHTTIESGLECHVLRIGGEAAGDAVGAVRKAAELLERIGAEVRENGWWGEAANAVVIDCAAGAGKLVPKVALEEVHKETVYPLAAVFEQTGAGTAVCIGPGDTEWRVGDPIGYADGECSDQPPNGSARRR